MAETWNMDRVQETLGKGLRLWLAGWLLTGMGSHPLIAATYYVDPLLGDDTREAIQATNPDTPWKTLSHAMAHEVVGTGDTLRLATGTFSDDTGETFPITPKDGVSVIGDGAAFTQLYSYNDVLFDVSDDSLNSATLYADVQLDGDGYNAFRFVPDQTTVLAHFSDLNFGDGIQSAFHVSVEPGADAIFSPLIDNSTFTNVNNALYLSISASSGRRTDATGPTDTGMIFVPPTTVIANPTFTGNSFIGNSSSFPSRSSTSGFSGTAIYMYARGQVSGELSPVFEQNTARGGSYFLDVEVGVFDGVGDLEVSPVLKSNTISGLNGQGTSVSISAFMAEPNHFVTYSPLFINNTLSDIGGPGFELYRFSGSSSINFESQMVIAGNTFSRVGYDYDYPIYASASSMYGNIDLDWKILNNTISNDHLGNGIYLSVFGLSYATGDVKLTVAGNTITNAQNALYVYMGSFSSNNVDADITLSGNTMTGTSDYAISLNLSSLSSAGDVRAEISDNRVTGGSNDAMYLSLPQATTPAKMQGNTVLNNRGSAVFIDGLVDLGGGEAGSRGFNTFLGNDVNITNNTDAVVSAQNNYWGLTEPTPIDETNNDDEEEYGENVDVSSPLLAPPTVTATASYNATLKTDPGENGASEGDTLHYTLTITGTGQAGCGEAAVMAHLPSNASWVSGAESTSKGVFHNEGEHIKVALGNIAPAETITVEWDLMLGEGCADVAVDTVVSCRELGALPLSGNGSLYAIGEKNFWPDADDDGFGATTGLLTACSEPEGYVSNKNDCDDSSNTINPDSAEICDDIDQDCDGTADNGLETSVYYADADADGYGNRASAQSKCDRPEGFVLNANDCDDLNNQINPEQAEICDGQDNNCNEQIDEGVGTTWYQDSDDDGYGDPEDSTVDCTAPEGYVSNNFDCNDEDDAAFTDAAEICDGIDNDCDGETDDVGDTIFYADADDDGFGTKDDAVISCNRPSGTVTNSDDCNDDNQDINPDASETCDSVDNDCDGLIDENLESLFFADEDGDGFGNASEPLTACSAPEGYVNNSDDCRDSVAAINPDATEVCDGDDNNCDGVIDDVDGCVTDVSPSPTPDVDVTGGAGCSCDTRNSEAPAPVGGAVGLAFAAFLLLRRRR